MDNGKKTGLSSQVKNTEWWCKRTDNIIWGVAHGHMEHGRAEKCIQHFKKGNVKTMWGYIYIYIYTYKDNAAMGLQIV